MSANVRMKLGRWWYASSSFPSKRLIWFLNNNKKKKMKMNLQNYWSFVLQILSTYQESFGAHLCPWREEWDQQIDQNLGSPLLHQPRSLARSTFAKMSSQNMKKSIFSLNIFIFFFLEKCQVSNQRNLLIFSRITCLSCQLSSHFSEEGIKGVICTSF